jgi:integrase
MQDEKFEYFADLFFDENAHFVSFPCRSEKTAVGAAIEQNDPRYVEALDLRKRLSERLGGLAKSSIRQYDKAIRHVSTTFAFNVSCTNNRRGLRAALMWWAAKEFLDDPLTTLDSIVRSTQIYKSSICLIKKITSSNFDFIEVCDAIKRCDESCLPVNAESMIFISSSHKPRKGRTAKLKHYPLDWREQFLDAIETKIPNVQYAIRVIALLGCRPGEIPSTHISMDGSLVRISVQNAKQGSKSKPQFRSALYSINEITEPLLDLADGNEFPFQQVNVKSVQNVIYHTGKKVGAFRKLSKQSISASDFRNQLASDCKRRKFSRKELAILLGHSSDRTQKFYGRSIHGQGGESFMPWEVIDSDNVRQSALSYQSRPFQINSGPETDYPQDTPGG